MMTVSTGCGGPAPKRRLDRTTAREHRGHEHRDQGDERLACATAGYRPPRGHGVQVLREVRRPGPSSPRLCVDPTPDDTGSRRRALPTASSPTRPHRRHRRARDPRALSHPWLLRWSPFHAATAVLHVPHNPADYSVGASKQTLRRMVQAARKKGVNWTQVHDHAERVRLLSLANDWERRHPLPRYREGKPHNDDLLDSACGWRRTRRMDVPFSSASRRSPASGPCCATSAHWASARRRVTQATS